MPTGDSARVLHVGNCSLEGGDILTNVLCVPVYKINLISVFKMTKDLNYCATFYPDYFVLHDISSGKVMEIGKQKDVLYTLYSQVKKGTIGNMCFASTQKEDVLI